ncbi:MAG: hypothetical protein JWN44_4472 [Myxococcales bacterium]|nr:hypothetical protein [Myxococcales bacterium]
MNEDRKTTDKNAKSGQKQKLVLRKQSIRQLDAKELAIATGGHAEPPDGGVCSQGRHQK